jgi:molecular chaperone Hsp33
MLQNIAEDDARGPTHDAWETAQALFETLGEDELVEPTLSPERLLFRLFHENGVRLFRPQPLRAFCRCSQERIESVLRSFPASERADMVEADGKIRVTCEYCSRTYELTPEMVDG